MKTDFVRARIEPHLKSEVHAVLDAMGITPTQAITMFYKQITLHHRLPFDVSLPNAETAKVIKVARHNQKLIASASTEDLFTTLDL